MKIPIYLNNNSIQNSINKLKQAKIQLTTTAMKDLLKQSCIAIIQLANARLQTTTIGEEVKKDIMNGWLITEPIGNTIILQNTNEKAVYVEFGVGVVGQENSHPNAKSAGYGYNVPSESKTQRGYWVFGVDDKNEIDLQDNNYKTNQGKNALWVITKGSPATMFLYQACMDFIDKQGYKAIWEKIKIKYWG